MNSHQIDIEHHNRHTHGEYLATTSDGQDAGKLTWTLRGQARDAGHTLVPSSMRGKGIAQKLVDALIDDARREGFKIVPSCSYVARQFDRHPEWSDLRA